MSDEIPKIHYDLILARDAALRRAEQAEQRERIAAEAYNGQQQSYRELETLYQAAQERALRAEADAAELCKGIYHFTNMLREAHNGTHIHRVAGEHVIALRTLWADKVKL